MLRTAGHPRRWGLGAVPEEPPGARKVRAPRAIELEGSAPIVARSCSREWMPTRRNLTSASVWAIAVLAGATPVFVPSTPASAGLVEAKGVRVYTDGSYSQGKPLRYRAKTGERNRLKVVARGERAFVRDATGVTPGAGCRLRDADDATRAVCDFSRTPKFQDSVFTDRSVVRVSLRDGDDAVSVSGRGLGVDEVTAELDGGTGDDLLSPGDHGNLYRGGAGDDVIRGVGTALEGRRANGSDTFLAGAGVDYSRRSRPIHADAARDRDDGERGERDLIGRGAGGRIAGGSGNDRLAGGPGDTVILGGAGRDRISGGRGDDVLFAGAVFDYDGFDHARARTADVLRGGPGSDRLLGSDGNNRMYGGPGRDSLLGFGGSDRLGGRDSFADELRCGRGRDRALLDALDYFMSRGRQRCEAAYRPVPGSASELGGSEGPKFYDPIGTQYDAAIPIACPGDAPRVCRGRARLLYKGRLMARGKFRLRRNSVQLFEVKVTRRARALIQRHERLEVIALVSSRDRFGTLRTYRGIGNTLVDDCC